MTKCSIKQCSARKNRNQPKLTLHRFPRNKAIHRKWLEIIGAKNLNSGHAGLYVCSMHFEEASFNRTLDVVRLRDNAVPLLLLVPARNTCQRALSEVENTQEPASSGTTQPHLAVAEGSLLSEEPARNICQQGLREVGNTQEPTSSGMTQPHLAVAEGNLLSGKGELSIQIKYDDYMLPSTSRSLELTKPVNPGTQEKHQPMLLKNKKLAVETIQHSQSSKVNSLQKICNEQRKTIKRLNEKVRRQGIKIISMQSILKDLENKMMIDTEQSISLEESGGLDFLIYCLTNNNIRKRNSL